MEQTEEILPFRLTDSHSYHRRSFRHDYFAPFIYHLILKKSPACETFGTIDGDARVAPGQPGCARVKESEIGSAVAKEILRLHYRFPIVKLLQFVVMPDHAHILLQILHRSDRHLDFYVDALKTAIAVRVSLLRNQEVSPHEIFEPGYCDKPLYDNRSLDAMFRYIRENPHRLAVRKQYPQFFQHARKVRFGETDCEAYGNLLLLNNPDKLPVKISRRDTDGEVSAKTARWVAEASRGTILVSPFISPKEKEVRRQAEEAGAKIILITHEAFPERFKPARHDFELCCAGRLLILSMGCRNGEELTRELCLAMNALAQRLSR